MARRITPHWSLAALGAVPVLVWWLGWYPGFASSDSIDQFGMIQSGVIFGYHPAIHTLYMGGLSLGGGQPGLVTLFQIIAFGGLLAYAAYWLIRAGVPRWLAIAVCWALGLSPAIAPTTITLWKDVPFGLFFLWAWIELLALAVKRGTPASTAAMVRLGVALGGVWLFRGNGPLTVLLTLLILTWVFRRQVRSVVVMAASLAAVVLLVLGPVHALVDVQGSGIEPATVFLPDVAGSYNSEPETFEPDDIDLIDDLAPLQIWTSRYTCYDSTPLLFDPAFDVTPVRERSDVYRDLELRVLFRDPDSVIEHRVCAANFVYSPVQPADAYFHRPEYDIPANDVGLERSAISDRAFAITDWLWRWAEVDERLWLTWRPAILILPALAVVLLFAVLGRGRRFLIPSALFLAHLANVAATSPAQEFRYAYPLYLVAALTIPLAWPTLAGTDRGRHVKRS
jgi:hypothetical protein